MIIKGEFSHVVLEKLSVVLPLAATKGKSRKTRFSHFFQKLQIVDSVMLRVSNAEKPRGNLRFYEAAFVLDHIANRVAVDSLEFLCGKAHCDDFLGDIYKNMKFSKFSEISVNYRSNPGRSHQSRIFSSASTPAASECSSAR